MGEIRKSHQTLSVLTRCAAAARSFAAAKDEANGPSSSDLLLARRTCPLPWYELVRNVEFDAAVQRAVEGTLHGIGLVDVLDYVAHILGRGQSMVNENSTNNQDAVLGFHLAAHVAGECSLPRLDVPRCQRGGKRALQSSGRGRNDVIERSGARFLDGGRV